MIVPGQLAQFTMPEGRTRVYAWHRDEEGRWIIAYQFVDGDIIMVIGVINEIDAINTHVVCPNGVVGYVDWYLSDPTYFKAVT